MISFPSNRWGDLSHWILQWIDSFTQVFKQSFIKISIIGKLAIPRKVVTEYLGQFFHLFMSEDPEKQYVRLNLRYNARRFSLKSCLHVLFDISFFSKGLLVFFIWLNSYKWGTDKNLGWLRIDIMHRMNGIHGLLLRCKHAYENHCLNHLGWTPLFFCFEFLFSLWIEMIVLTPLYPERLGETKTGGGGRLEGGSYYVSHGKGTGIMSNYEWKPQKGPPLWMITNLFCLVVIIL